MVLLSCDFGTGCWLKQFAVKGFDYWMGPPVFSIFAAQCLKQALILGSGSCSQVLNVAGMQRAARLAHWNSGTSYSSMNESHVMQQKKMPNMGEFRPVRTSFGSMIVSDKWCTRSSESACFSRTFSMTIWKLTRK